MVELNLKIGNNNIKLKANICENIELSEYEKFEYLRKMCKKGCSNYNTNYTCPPQSPRFSDYVKDYKYSLIIAMYMDIPEDKTMMEVHSYLREKMEYFLINIEDKVGGLLTDSGRCIKCKNCTYLDNLPCRFPQKMRYSMESMGIDLSKVSEEILNHSMVWSKNSKNNYCTVMGSVILNDVEKYNLKEMIENLINIE